MVTNAKSSPEPLVSIIVPTRNSAGTLKSCLSSIKAQTYPKIELIVVDRSSTDATVAISKKFTPHVYDHGPERSAQRNLGAARATGMYLLFIDSDMELDPTVVKSCFNLMEQYPKLAAVTIPEVSFGNGFWAKCKALERHFYNGIDWMESPRFMPTALFRKSGGYDESIAGGEDWDLTKRLRTLGTTGRVSPLIYHNEGRLSLRSVVKKRLYYAQGFSKVYAKGRPSPVIDALKVYSLFFSRPAAFIRHPLQWIGMIFMKSTELSASAIGYAIAKRMW